MSRVWPQPLIVSRDVVGSSRFYTELLGADSGHGGDEYEQVVADGEILLQIHRLDVMDHHGPLADESVPLGNGIVVWFEVADFDAAVSRARGLGAHGREGRPHEPEREAAGDLAARSRTAISWSSPARPSTARVG